MQILATSAAANQGRAAPGGSGAIPPQADISAARSFYHLVGADVRATGCQGTACFVARHLNPARWEESCSKSRRVYCLGQCFAAPASGAEEGRPRIEIHSREGIVLGRLANGGARSLSAYRGGGGYRALETALALSPEEVIERVAASELRGRGGAAFPAGRKWRAVFEAGGPGKYVVANADEGDAGAYIDRYLLEDDPHALLEGMAIAGYAVGADRGWIYLRKEYPGAQAPLEAALAEARGAGFLGVRGAGRAFAFDIELFTGEGSYICGEETAMLQSIAGNRPEATARPPYPTERGLFGMPTLVHNVETLVNVPWIVRHGPKAYRALGFSRSRGTKVVSLNSLFRRPGLYEVEFGVSMRHIVEALGGGLNGGALRGVMVGGPLAGILPPDLLDTPFGFEELRAIGAGVGHGGVVAFDDHTSIAELLRHVVSFAAYESCGKCAPCRLGSRRLEEILSGIATGMRPGTGDADGPVMAEVEQLVGALRTCSLCGHGIGLGEFAESVLRHYRRELASCLG